MGKELSGRDTGDVIRPKEERSSRRQWSVDQKKQIVDEALSPGASVSQVSRRIKLERP